MADFCGVVVVGISTDEYARQWDQALSNFTPDLIWTLDDRYGHEATGYGLGRATRIGDFGELPDEPLVVLAPRSGRYVQGATPLHEFEHPSRAIYVFGADHTHMQPVTEKHLTVWVPTDTRDEMFAAACWCVVGWHRRLCLNI